MSFTEEVTKRFTPQWNNDLQCDFVRGIKDGTLADSKFQHYLAQDYIYLISYMRVLAKGMVNAKTNQELTLHLSALHALYDYEVEFRADTVGGAVADTIPTPECKAYTDYIESFIPDSDNLRIAAAVLDCLMSYEYIFQALNQDITEDNPYYEFVTGYASPEYASFCREYKAYVDELYRYASETQWQEAFEIVAHCEELEAEFWEMAFND